MTKTEIISRIIDRITDPATETPEAYRDAVLVNLDEAKILLAVYRDDDINFDPDNRLPDETTPELLMEAINCNVRYQQRQLTVNHLTDYITENEMVCEYANYYKPTNGAKLDIIPMDYFLDDGSFKFLDRHGDPISETDAFRIGFNSADTFDPNDDYCWFDARNEIIHSESQPFKDGILDAHAFAEFILSDPEALHDIIEDMHPMDVKYIFIRSKDDMLKGGTF